MVYNKKKIICMPTIARGGNKQAAGSRSKQSSPKG
ncbi:hypothetical protein PBAL39_06261 [Pedobacter sp. BAL39]|nr:hypothetical protein PBAL39_06261 [Pedobacter sp. BAL39]